MPPAWALRQNFLGPSSGSQICGKQEKNEKVADLGDCLVPRLVSVRQVPDARHAKKSACGYRNGKRKTCLGQGSNSDDADREIGHAQLAHEWQHIVTFDSKYLLGRKTRLKELTHPRDE